MTFSESGAMRMKPGKAPRVISPTRKMTLPIILALEDALHDVRADLASRYAEPASSGNDGRYGKELSRTAQVPGNAPLTWKTFTGMLPCEPSIACR